MKTKYISIIIVAVLLSGCSRDAVNKNQYAFISPPQTGQQPEQLNMVLEIRPFSIDPSFSSRQMVYRVSEFKYVQDYYNEFLVSPAVMITHNTRNWLSQSNMFTTVLEPGSTVNPTHILEGSISQCYADMRNRNSPAAVLKIQMSLVKRDKTDLLAWSKTYDADQPMKDRSAESFIDAINQCLQAILQNMQTDMALLQ